MMNPTLLPENLHKLVGNTPCIAISYRYNGGPVQEVLAKCENFNLTGSIKDRLALYVLQQAAQQEKLKPGDQLVVAPGTNTNIAFAAVGRALGYRVLVIINTDTTIEMRALIKSYGAEIQLADSKESAAKLAVAMGHYDGMFVTAPWEERYQNEVHEKITGREIGRSLLLENLRPAALVAGTGTGGTLLGTSHYLRSLYPGMDIFQLQPERCSHRITGYCEPAIALGTIDGSIPVADGDAILMTQRLAKELGLTVGISSGANLLGAIKAGLQSGSDRPMLTLFPDDHKKYSAELSKIEPVLEHYISPGVELLDYRTLNKV